MKLQQPFYIEKRKSENHHLDLGGKWDFCYRANAAKQVKRLKFEHKATIPAGTYWNLYEAGVLPHPYEGENSHLYKFVDQKVWYYRRRFNVSGYSSDGNAYLCFDGMGYFSRVWVNGKLVGEHEGLFGGPIVDINSYLNFEGENELIVEVKSCNYRVPDEEWKTYFRSPRNPHLVPWNMVKDTSTSNGDFSVMGIYRDVRIEFVDKMHLSRPYLVTENISDTAAKLHLSVEIATGEIDELAVPMNDITGDAYVYGYVNGINVIDSDREVEIKVELTEKTNGKTAFLKTFSKKLYDYSKLGLKEKYHECQFFEKDIEIENPCLWYPVGLGAPELYTVKLTLLYGGAEKDVQTFDFGIRTYSMEYSAAERLRTRWGKYQSVVNGKRFFLKGMNWTPLDFLLTSTEQDYRWALDQARAENIQMIRVWGAGNAPEHDVFYELCDEFGIMVWQDSFLSNHDSPLWDKELFKFQQCMYIYRIRNHPSLVIHCSGNENNPYAVDNHCVWVWQRECEDLDPSRVQIRTTPDKGSAHVYRGFEPTWYRKMYKNLPFMGEAGTHTFPNAKTLKKLISAKEYETPIDRFGSDNMIENYKELGNHITEFDAWGLYKKIPSMSHIIDINNVTVENLCEATGIASYEYYQFMVQALREQYPVTAGILPWVFKRPWPTVAVQMIDGLGDPVAPYYAVKNAYEDVEIHLALNELVYAAGDTVELDTRIINESGNTLRGKAVTTVYDANLKKVFAKKAEVSINADKYQTKLPEESFEIPLDWCDKYFFLHTALYVDGKKVSQSFYWPMVLEKMKDNDFKSQYRADNVNVLTHEQGPWLMPQIQNTCDDGIIDCTVESINYEDDRIVGTLILKNESATPAFPVKITALNDSLVQYLTDDSFFMETGEIREIKFTLRNDEKATEKVRFSVKAWNKKENIIEA